MCSVHLVPLHRRLKVNPFFNIFVGAFEPLKQANIIGELYQFLFGAEWRVRRGKAVSPFVNHEEIASNVETHKQWLYISPLQLFYSWAGFEIELLFSFFPFPPAFLQFKLVSTLGIYFANWNITKRKNRKETERKTRFDPTLSKGFFLPPLLFFQFKASIWINRLNGILSFFTVSYIYMFFFRTSFYSILWDRTDTLGECHLSTTFSSLSLSIVPCKNVNSTPILYTFD